MTQSQSPQSTTANPFQNKRVLPGISRVIAVSSGKGGVGKSTVAVNLAAALAKTHKVGLLDADVYGPSIPRLVGLTDARPQVNAQNKIEPLVKFGMKVMSMGFLIDENAAVVWRGPMLFKAMDQFLNDVQWGELDYLIIDLPPGTGDIQLTLAQKIYLAGALIVTTPQNLAFVDAKKAIDMWTRLDVPIIGVVENMSYMLASNSSERVQLYPKGELDQYLIAKKLTKLTELPFNPNLAICADKGLPICEGAPDSVEAQAFANLAAKM
jgi:ATP-binding protein involved in chromosome partitioning